MPKFRKYIPWKRVESLDELVELYREGNRYFWGLFAPDPEWKNRPHHWRSVAGAPFCKLLWGIEHRTIWVSNLASDMRFVRMFPGDGWNSNDWIYCSEREKFVRPVKILPDGSDVVIEEEPDNVSIFFRVHAVVQPSELNWKLVAGDPRA